MYHINIVAAKHCLLKKNYALDSHILPIIGIEDRMPIHL